MRELLKNLIGGVIATAVLLLAFYLLGIIVNIIEAHFWLIIPIIIIDLILIFKEF